MPVQKTANLVRMPVTVKTAKTLIMGSTYENHHTCTLDAIKKYKNLSQKKLEKLYELPCECEEVPLKDLIDEYNCSDCGETYFYSFCWDEVAQDSCSWHCDICKTCRDWREWHCENCNKCTYGVSLPCDNCGAPGPMADFL